MRESLYEYGEQMPIIKYLQIIIAFFTACLEYQMGRIFTDLHNADSVR